MTDSDELYDDELDDGDYEPPEGTLPNPYAVPEVEALLEEAIEILAEARPLPMSTTVKVARDELLHLLEQAQEQLPDEVRAARWLLKEREDFIAKARREHKALIDEGRAQVSRMVERQQVVKDAEARARRILDDAQAEANLMKRQVEEYCDRKLARFESVLAQTTETVQKGRQKLLGMSEVPGAAPREWGDEWSENGPPRRAADLDLRDSMELEGERR
ncbi:MAG: hypothetical protein OEV40_12525 [Acidimicrobiia bacterium]|nr:hypothetical protein [Acidimicrobiia bacterium]